MGRKAILGFVVVVLVGVAFAAGVLVGRRFSSEPALSDHTGKAYSAKGLYARAEEKLTEARTLRFSFEATFRHHDKGAATLKGSAAFAEGGKMHLEILEAPKELGPQGTVVSDGTNVRARRAGGDETVRPVTKSDLARAEEFRSVFCYCGAAFGLSLEEQHVRDLEPWDIKLGPKEKLDGRVAQVIEYDLNIKFPQRDQDGKPILPEPAFHVKLWIDGGTGLPVKREILFGKEGIVETYREMKVDGDIDPKTFEVTAKFDITPRG